jgi:DeoR/GlpR family transcriptional regulator of sugar metabolism
MITITWTISLPNDERIASKIERRRQRLLRLLSEADAQGGSPTIGDLSQAIGASEATVRRDLNALRSDGHTINTRGSRSHH